MRCNNVIRGARKRSNFAAKIVGPKRRVDTSMRESIAVNRALVGGFFFIFIYFFSRFIRATLKSVLTRLFECNLFKSS